MFKFWFAVYTLLSKNGEMYGNTLNNHLTTNVTTIDAMIMNIIDNKVITDMSMVVLMDVWQNVE